MLAGIELSEWRLVGPGLAALIVALALRFRLSRARIQEFLAEWLGLELSIGTIHQTLHEASAAVAPARWRICSPSVISPLSSLSILMPTTRAPRPHRTVPTISPAWVPPELEANTMWETPAASRPSCSASSGIAAANPAAPIALEPP